MLLAALLLLLVYAIGVSLVIWFLATLDSDLSLYYVHRFGRKASKCYQSLPCLACPKHDRNLTTGDLQGKVMWITGASSGIGESLAYRASLAGLKLVLSGTNEQALQDVRSKCLTLMPASRQQDSVLVLPFNLKDVASHGDQVAKAVTFFGHIDILVNNAGRSQRALFHEVDVSVDQEMFAINVLGTISLTRALLRRWYEDKTRGHIVVTSSTLGKTGIMNGSTYAGTKHALHGYMESVRHEAFARGISVTMVCPGPTISRAAERAFTTDLQHVFQPPSASSSSAGLRRMKTDRCSQLMMTAIANRVDEAWICQQPVLLIYYLSQYAPSLSRWLVPRLLTGDRVARLREGH